MNHGELRTKVREHFKAILEKAKASRDEIGPYTELEKERIVDTIRLHETNNEDFWNLLGRDYARSELDKFCSCTGVKQPKTREDAFLILGEIKKAQLAQIKALLEHDKTFETYDFSTLPSAPVNVTERPETTSGNRATKVERKPPEVPSSPLLSDLFAERKAEAEQTGQWSAKLVNDYQTWTDLFIELQGDRPVLDYNKPDARDFKNVLLELPSNRNKLPQTIGLSPRDAIQAAKDHELPTLSVSTVNKALGRLQGIWKWADKQLDEEVADIFGPMKVDDNNKARNQHDPFSKEQLQTIFKSPLFTGCKSRRFRTMPGDTDLSDTSWFWLPLLGLWTGARLNELCQLSVEDIDQEEGIPLIRVQEGDEDQRVKFGKSRIVPIHPELVRLGFLQFVQAQRDAGATRVFPELKVGAMGYHSEQASKDFSRYIKSIGAKTRKTSFHSFRHTFKDACRHSGMQPDINDILLGHTLPGMAGRYGDGNVPVQVLFEAMCKVKHKDLSLHHIKGYP
ncbi:site-specific integrase [Ruegeria profundi]|uniref:site-specific integrase n=1 Tax=Ruegeria profundi TaxID=1685378 RepID=UPI001CD49F12|nr:site-specific integrase [Ruegeria profundi]MCA0930165.1 site-specific integrase [Ruegeria profundi]